MEDQSRRHFLKATAISAGGVMAMGAVAKGQTSRPANADESVNKENAKKQELAKTSPDHLHVAMLQINADQNNQESNFNKAEQYCRWARERGADIALLPEMYNIGYTAFQENDEKSVREWQAQAIARDSAPMKRFANLAQELDMAIAMTYLEKWDGAPRNSLTLFDRKGKEALTYAKVHTCDFAFEAATTPGEDFPVVTLDTAKGIVKTGSIICFDREFPEAARSLMLQGAELMIVPNACLLDDLRIHQFQVRAHENAMMCVMTNYSVLKGRSVAFNAAGQANYEAGEEEGIYSALFDLPFNRQYRSTTIWGNAFRRHDHYRLLTEKRELEVFKRNTMFGEEFIPEKR